MRLLVPRPTLLFLTLLLVVGTIALIELRFSAAEPDTAQTSQNPPPTTPEETIANPERNSDQPSPPEKTEEPKPAVSDAERIADKEKKYERAAEIVGPTGFINTDDVSIKEAAGEKVVLLQFWTYSCYNCQNAQPYINSFHEEYVGEGLQVIGIHKPEFEFEKDYASVAEAVRQENIQYPVVLDNNDSTWDAYDNRYWPTWHLIDADGFVRYEHIGEGGYEETEEEIQELLAEKDQASN
ncbi:MAG: redoxin domain-containing protein [Rubrobacteraceae bacterium]